MKRKTKVLIIVCVTLVLIVICAFLLLKKTNKDVANNRIEEIKNFLGQGTNGEIEDIVEGKDDEGNRTYTIIYNDGDERVITISKIDEDSSLMNEESSDESSSTYVVSSEIEEGSSSKEEPGTAYERYELLTVKEKEAFYNSFASPDDFYIWYAKAREEYDNLHPTIEVSNNEIVDVGEKKKSLGNH